MRQRQTQTRRTRRGLSLAAVGAAALLLTGCASGDAGTGGGTTNGGATTTASTAATPPPATTFLPMGVLWKGCGWAGVSISSSAVVAAMCLSVRGKEIRSRL